ncbi:family 3 extracellular solute-binding protein [Actinobaculum suis]|uniref:Family 3 extracellular solute-binding protein n=2 Tax=Actinobaculum suis TaxID=1657 RepID=A0A7Z9C850_9ACTO|nr:ABC transporter substrate-binding protein [Actinobaculum suis]VDG76085.1 family 3 extracellular solute-binding protein [Actinobaculum suis]
MNRTPARVAMAALACFGLSACTPAVSAFDNDPGETGYDVSHIEAVPEIAAQVPENIRARGVLRNGASTNWPPLEYRKSDGQTPTGYEIDLTRALAKVMGLRDGTTQHTEFDALLPQIGTKFDVGLSGFTVTKERLQSFNMIAYSQAGTSWAVAAGNPAAFTPEDPCGFTIGVQTGTSQYDFLKETSAQCEAEGKPEITIMPMQSQAQISVKVASGQYDATLADSPVIGYSVVRTEGKLEHIGEEFDSAPQAVVVPLDDPELAQAVEDALNYLIDTGELEKILSYYGASGVALPHATLNPEVN